MVKMDKGAETPNNQFASQKAGTQSPHHHASASPPVSQNPGTNLTHLLPSGNPTQNSPAPIHYGTAANTSGWILDLLVKVVTIHGKEITGRVFTYDTISNCIILKTESSPNESSTQEAPLSPGAANNLTSFEIVKISCIQSITPLNPADILANEEKIKSTPIDHVMLSSAPSPRHLNLRAFVSREVKTLNEEMERMIRTNSNAPARGQELFDAIIKIFPTNWDKDDIIVLGEVRIKPPYNVESCELTGPGSALALDRVKKTVEAERKKLDLDKSPPATPAIPATSTPKSDFRSSPSGKKDAVSNDKSNGLGKKDNKGKDSNKK